MTDRCAGGVKLKGNKDCSVCGAGTGDQCAKAALRDWEELQALRNFVGWVDSWVSNPVGAYSVMALDGLFGMTRDKIAALPHIPQESASD